MREIAFESFGVRIGVRASDARIWERLPEMIPPHSTRCEVPEIGHRFSVTMEDELFTMRYDIRDGEHAKLLDPASWICANVDLELVLGLLETHLHGTVALRAVDRTFVYGGAVAYRDRAVILPAAALTGKSTLVAALVRAGATYYSDTFAVLDPEGRVHPYATPIRLPGADRIDLSENGDQPGRVGDQALPVGAIVMTGYRPGAEWRPRRLSRGEGVISLMAQTVPAMERPDESMHVVRHAFDSDPVVIASDRDEAELLASSLLSELEREFSASA
ncbi:MAG: hypothetical protein ACJ75Z_03240 [Solirubrobacterales bacterium]